MQITLKPEVVTNIEPDLLVALGWIYARWQEMNLGPFVVTSAKDGTHMAGSAHKQDQPPKVLGRALDIRTRHRFSEEHQTHDPLMVEFARMLQKENLAVVLHPDFKPELKVPPHLHIALKFPIFLRE